MIRSIFTRDGHPGATDPAVPEAIIAAEMKFGDTIPTGTYLDMAVNLPMVDPKKVLSPVLMMRGSWDGNSTNEDLLDFYTQLPNGDRQFVILPNTAHSPGYSKNRHLLWYAVKNFLGGAGAGADILRRKPMKIVQGDELEWVRGLEYRGGTFHYRNLMEGEPGTIDNFQLSMGRNDKDFVSPRHRHNFEQFRFQLEGDLNFARDGMMTPGMVGYFPEGASYGPQTSEATAMTLVLQFGGASGQGYLSRKEAKQA